MTKMRLIESCLDCVFHQWHGPYLTPKRNCMKLDRDFAEDSNRDAIPYWCPLEDAPTPCDETPA